MELNAFTDVAAPRHRVWLALNDPAILQQCIDGCESLEATDNGGFSGVVVAKVGPVKARFAGVVTISDIVAETSYTLSGEGKGGVAGFAKGSAAVRLESLDATTTRLHYDVKASVGGKLAQLGARLIESTARSYAQNFFERFGGLLASEPAPGSVSPSAAAPPVADPEPVAKPTGLPMTLWAGGLILLAAAVIAWLLRG